MFSIDIELRTMVFHEIVSHLKQFTFTYFQNAKGLKTLYYDQSTQIATKEGQFSATIYAEIRYRVYTHLTLFVLKFDITVCILIF